MKPEAKQEESFGIIPLSKKKGYWEVFIIQHHRGGYWGFPKGHAEPNESSHEAAVRELKEETNLDLAHLIQKDPLLEQYSFMMEGKRVFKKVLYFIAEVEGTVSLQKKEIYDGKWLPIPDALNRVTHQEGKEILKKVEKILPAPEK